MAKDKTKRSWFQKSLDGIETVGNRLPHPVTLFLLFSLVVMAVSHVSYLSGSSVTYQGVSGGQISEVTVSARSLLTREGIAWMFSNAVRNFTGFAPLGTVLVAMLGVGAAENLGMISVLLRKLILGTPRTLITLVVAFVGLMSSVASDAGYLIVIPLGAAIFHSIGRHPIAGLAAAFFGVSGGFAANFLITTNDVMLSAISTEAAKMIDPAASVPVTGNWWFMMVSTVLLTLLITLITEKLVEPRLGAYNREGGDVVDSGVSMEITADEKRGLRFAGIGAILIIGFIVALSATPSSPLRNPVTGELVPDSPFMTSLVFIIALLFLIPAIGYGIGARTIKSDKGVVTAMTKSMQHMGGYLVLAFFAAQFINYFSYSQLGTILSVNGALFLRGIGFTGLPLILAFVLLCAFINLFMGSSSAKWAIMAPVFIPMFMQLGFAPEFTQVAYRVGESVTNVITPLMSYFALIVVFAEKYDRKAGIGTLIATMLPYVIIILPLWTLLLVIWYFTGMPIGLGGTIFLP